MSNTTRYGVLIDGGRGGYGVVFPDLPGCYSRWGAPSTRLCVMPWGRPANGRKLSLSRARDRLRHCATTKAALADGAVLAVVPFERGKPGRGEYLASQPAR